MNTIVNLTQHAATSDQLISGVVEPDDDDKMVIVKQLTFHSIPTKKTIELRAATVAKIACKYKTMGAMIGGAPYFMSTLEETLKTWGITPVYAFSQRESIEEIQTDGSVVKKNVFRHAGWVVMS